MCLTSYFVLLVVVSNSACYAVVPVPRRADLLPPPTQQPPRILGSGGGRFGVQGGGIRDLRPFRLLQERPVQGKKVPRLYPFFFQLAPTCLGTNYSEIDYHKFRGSKWVRITPPVECFTKGSMFHQRISSRANTSAIFGE